MDYATSYDVGERKREGGINEDSVAIAVFEEGHREGLLDRTPGIERAQDAGSESGEPPAPAESDREEGPGEGQAEAADADDGDGDVGDTDAAAGDGDTDADDGPEAGGTGAGADGTGEGDDGAAAATEAASTAERDEDPAEGTAATEDPPSAANVDRSAAAFALADGAGGHDAGDVASYIATTVIAEELAPTAIRAARSQPEAFGVDLDTPAPQPPTPAEVRSAVAEAIVTAHREILRYAEASGAGAFTTVVAGVYVDGHLHYGWVGDSRAYVLNGVTDDIERLTTDHAVVADLEAAGEVDAVEAMVHPRGNEITRALGGHPGEDPETATVEVATDSIEVYAEDVVLVTSDGLVDAQTDAPALYDRYVESGRDEAVAEEVREAVVTDADIREWVFGASDLDAAAADLVAAANARGGKDNISTILFRDVSLPATPDDGPRRSLAGEGPITDRETVVQPDE